MPINVSDFVLQPMPVSDQGAIERLGQYAERNRERQDQRKEQNRLFNLKQINAATDPDQYKTGDAALNAYSQQELKGIMDKAFTNYANLDPVEMQYRLKNDMNDFLKWHNAANAKSEEIKSQLADFNKTYPNVDFEKAHNIAYKNLEGDFLDANGKRRSPEMINLGRNYVGELHDPEVLSQITNDISPAQKYYSSSKAEPFHNSEYTSVRGVKNRDRFSGYYSPDKQEIVADEQGNPVIDVKNELVPAVEKNGQPLKIIDQNQYSNIIGNPADHAAFLKKWALDQSPIGRQAIEQKYFQNNGQPISSDPHFKEIAFRHWLYEDAKKNLQSYINKDKAEVVPVTKVYTGGANGGETNINDLYSRVHSQVETKNTEYKNGKSQTNTVGFEDLDQDAQDQITAQAKKFDSNIDGKDIELAVTPDNKIGIFKKGTGDRIGYWNPMVNLKVQPGAKEKRGVINQNTPTSNNSYVYNGKTFSQEQIEKIAKQNNVSVDEYLKQQPGIKIVGGKTSSQRK